jgi:hypothetical protein
MTIRSAVLQLLCATETDGFSDFIRRCANKETEGRQKQGKKEGREERKQNKASLKEKMNSREDKHKRGNKKKQVKRQKEGMEGWIEEE